MKKLIFVGILGLFVLGSCNNSTVTHTHDEHDHAAEGHNHCLLYTSDAADEL